jgi:hypothetical protein
MMDLLVLFLLGASVLCLVCGLWIGYRDRARGRQTREAVSTPPDEEILIFDRVTEGLSQIPGLDDPGALWAAKKEVIQRVADQYGLKSADVGLIYRRVWQWKHGNPS